MTRSVFGPGTELAMKENVAKAMHKRRKVEARCLEIVTMIRKFPSVILL